MYPTLRDDWHFEGTPAETLAWPLRKDDTATLGKEPYFFAYITTCTRYTNHTATWADFCLAPRRGWGRISRRVTITRNVYPVHEPHNAVGSKGVVDVVMSAGR